MDLPQGLLAGALGGLPAQLAVLDQDGTIVYTNDRWRSFALENDVEGDPDDVGRNYLDVTEAAAAKDEYAAEAAAGLRAVLAGDRDEFRLEYPCHSPDQKRWFLLYASPYEYEGERYAIVEHLDITDRRLAEDDLSTSNERLETVASVLSHDLRNPISVALGYLEELEARLDGEDEYVEGIRNSLDRMQRIIEDALVLARQGEVGDLEMVDLHAAATGAWGNVDLPAATLDLGSSMQFRADASLLDSLFENLFRNAAEHGATSPVPAASGGAGDDGPDREPSVTVTVGSLSDRTGFYVEDDGPGIPDDQAEAVFEPGFTTGDEQNTGLGLAIVSAVAEAHGWTVDLADTEAGARFEITGVESPG
ncbi:sensor histidine kinase [Haloarchaeobius amylolyticus]|uniref:sensor histidine kinase n=1 Tax=Haloarchaeobius amylolyticus TaxID=1198296 RepID=UPI00226D797E|nr:PAS domain-containing sensor histidine kinase [Haloarchaeobius amylolyticus]